MPPDAPRRAGGRPGRIARCGLVALALMLSVTATAAPVRIALIGGDGSEGPARHDYRNGIRLLKELIESSPELGPAAGVQAETFPDGWPDDPAALDGAATVVWYFDGAERHPLLDASRRARFEALMRAGVGLVALHQSSTVPADDRTLGLERWLGAARYGTYDRATQDARLEPARAAHPVGRGVASFEHHDEFYPTFRFGAPGNALVPILTAQLSAEFRAGREPVGEAPSRATVAWVHVRAGGGRAFTYSGGHFLASWDEPMLRKLLLNAVAWTAGMEVPAQGMRAAPSVAALRAASAQTDTPTFHRGRARSGWNPHERKLTPARLAQGGLGLAWQSPPFDAFEGHPARLYASPLYVDRVRMSLGAHAGRTLSLVLAATSNGFVYAVNAFASRDIPAGTILWRTRLAAPCLLQPAPLDGVPTGILSTPIVDVEASRLYVTHCDPAHRWQAYALDLASGQILPGWPVRLDEPTLNRVNTNAGPPVPPRRRFDYRVQRAALNLSPDGAWLYVGFGESETGWIAAVDTRRARVASAFAVQAEPHRGSGGIWGAGGPALDEDGHVFVVTGTGYGGFIDRARDWTQSVLELSHEPETGLRLLGTYTPFNHCRSAAMDMDLGSGGAALLPPIEKKGGGAMRLMVVGGKQGNAYLLDRARLPGRLDRRPPCDARPRQDGSLLPPQPQPQFGEPGPLNVFGPYSEKDAAMDTARARSVPAVLRTADGRVFVFLTGTTRAAEGSAQSVPPSLARLEVVQDDALGPYLRIDQRETTLALENPGSPLVTSDGGRDAVVWVLDQNARRSAALAGPSAPRPVLYAFDAASLRLLWRSAPGALGTSGKYNQPAVARGAVFVGTDRIQAFSLEGRAAPHEPADAAATAPEPSPRASPAAAGVRDPATIYAQRCSHCHDDAQGSIPPREVIGRQPRARILEALSRGSMRPHAEGLAAAELEALAEYLR